MKRLSSHKVQGRGVVGKQRRLRQCPMKATIYEDQRLIMITGSIQTNKRDTQVLIPKVPVGKWRIIRAQVNNTDKSWKAWQIVFGKNTRVIKEDNVAASRQFTRFNVVANRNAIVLYGGDEVVPGEPILKTFEIEQVKEGVLSMLYHGPLKDPSDQEIKKGFKQRPIESFDLDTHYVSGSARS